MIPQTRVVIDTIHLTEDAGFCVPERKIRGRQPPTQMMTTRHLPKLHLRISQALLYRPSPRGQNQGHPPVFLASVVVVPFCVQGRHAGTDLAFNPHC